MLISVHIQVKKTDLGADNYESRRTLYDLRQPIFICLVDCKSSVLESSRATVRFSIYSTDRNANVDFVFNAHKPRVMYFVFPPKPVAKASRAGTANSAAVQGPASSHPFWTEEYSAANSAFERAMLVLKTSPRMRPTPHYIGKYWRTEST
jgi:hypothetical protein